MTNSPNQYRIGIIDTNIVIAFETLELAGLPEKCTITTITLAELAFGPHITDDLSKRGPRQERLQWAETSFREPLGLNETAAQKYAMLVAECRHFGREPKSRRFDLMIAAIAVANGLPLFTMNARDFAGLDRFLTVVEVQPNSARVQTVALKPLETLGPS